MEIDKVFNNDVDGVADNLFSAVKNSVSEIKAMQQRKAAENVQLVIRALKKLETELRETNEDVANQLALRIASIKDGRDGKDGKNGKDGRDGKAGRDGKDGNKGDKGADGRDGVDGVDGVSVVNANIDFDGSLIISLSDGREINVGEVVAPDLAERIKVISTMSTNGAVGIKDEGTSISTGVKTINFVGAAVTATNSGDDVTVNVSSGTGTVTSVGGTGTVSGISLSGTVTSSGNLTLGGSLDLSSPPTIGNTTPNTGTFTTLTVNDNSTLGSSNADTVTFTARIDSEFSPATDNTYDLGRTGNEWRDLYIDGTANIDSLIADTADINAGTIDGTTIGASTASTGAFTSLSDSGNLTFTGTGNRITGDFSNATIANRVAFQTSTTNSSTSVGILPNGTGTTALTTAFNNSDPTNAAGMQVACLAAESRINSLITGTGTYVPMTFYTGGSERVRIDTSGNVGIGTSSPAYPLDVRTASGGRVRFGNGTNNLDFFPTTGQISTGTDVLLKAFNASGIVSFSTGAGATERMRIDSSGNLLLAGTATPATGVGTFAIFNGTAPTASVTNGIVLYAQDVSSSSELKVRDEAGNVTTLSPHNFSMIPEGASEDMAWAHYSEKNGKRINVDMLKLARMVEKLTGEKLVYTD